MNYETLKVEIRNHVGLITLDRPKALNALSSAVLREISEVLAMLAEDSKIGAVVLAGSEKAFAAGADIKEMKDVTFIDAYLDDFLADWQRIADFRKPLIAAVSGYALGGGCELAMICDIVIAADTAKFGQPEITLGVMPGMGGTQRLTRSVGKAKAMDLCLTGRMMDAEEAERCGLVSRIVSPDDLIDEAMQAAEKIASYSMPVVMMAKEAVNRAFETPLSEGLRFEKRVFHSMFALEDQKEGMTAFSDKRSPQFKNR